MKKLTPITTKLVSIGLALFCASVARAAFSPIAVSGYNHDVVVEASAPGPLNDAVHATMDGGTNKNGNTWFEQGYYPGHTNGIPPAGSVFTSGNHKFQMPPNYHVNDVLMIGHNNGGRRPLIPSGTLTFTTPAAFSGLSV